MNRQFGKQLLRLLKPLFPHWTRNALQLRLKGIETYRRLPVLEIPPGERILVLVPHPDDESIGCGGSIRKSIIAGSRVRVVILTDGRNGSARIREMPDAAPEKAAMQNEMIATRQQETIAAMQHIGATDIDFLDAVDGALSEDIERMAVRLAAIITDWRPHTVILPFITDRHADHAATSRCLLAAASKMDRSCTDSLYCMGFETWSPIYANTLIDISDTIEDKLDAIRCYASQLEGLDYGAAIEGLNRYRALSGLTGGSHAEAYYASDFPEYARICNSLLL